ncbi:hypothetical protein HY029_06090 [Candidatus Gottesmanbacteria bacterium]|nr:hypothetical protein [Candidatus Gottesmanbacteria bacterium]
MLKLNLTKKSYTTVLILLFLLVGLASTVYLSMSYLDIRKKASYSGATLELIPASIIKNTGDTFTVGVAVNTGDETVSGADVHIIYEADKLEVQSITPGNFLPNIFSAGNFGGGNASIALVSQPDKPQKGSGILASINFKVLSSTPTVINFSSNTKIAAIGKTTNVLTSTQAAVINTPLATISSSSFASPSSIVTPSIVSPTLAITPTLKVPSPTSITPGDG